MRALLIAFVIVAGIQSGLIKAQDEETLDLNALLELPVLESKPCSTATNLDRFRLCNVCRPMDLVVEGLDRKATDIGLTEDRLRIAAESRLRSARLYTDSHTESNGAFLYINAGVVGRAWSLHVRYVKHLSDPVTGETSLAPAWQEGVFGTHSGDPGYIIQSLSEELDKFLVEYLRVNEKDCPR